MKPRRLLCLAWIAGIALVAPFPGAVRAATLFALVDTGELFASPDGGVSWAVRSTLPVRDAIVLVAGDTPSHLLLATESGSIHRSSDAGTTWSAISSVPAPDVVAMIPGPDRLLLLGRSGTVWVSLDEGASFAAAGVVTAPDVVGGTRLGSALFALTRSGIVHRSDDNGANWSAVSTLPVSDAIGITGLDSRLWVLTSTGALARSDPPWTGWIFAGTLSQTGMTAFLASGPELVASTAAGELAATASGASWTWRGTVGQITVQALGSDTPAITGVAGGTVAPFRFAPPWPNPAHERVRLTLDLPEPLAVTVEVFDLGGRRVARPIAGAVLPAGRTHHAWTPAGLPSGTYYIQARSRRGSETHRVVWLATRE